MKKTFSLLFCITSLICYSQETFYYEIKKVNTVSPLNIKEDFAPKIQHLEAPFSGSYSYFLHQQKRKNENQYPRTNTQNKKAQTSPESFIIGKELAVAKVVYHPSTGDTIAYQYQQGGVPNDNTLAISNNDIIVASYNSSIFTYDLNKDSVVFDPISLHAFSSEYTLNDKYDPKIKYDPINDKYILLFLNGRLSNENQIIVAFSTTNNPADEWNLYALPGNPLNNGTWSDYPAMAITKNDLFVTVNLLRDNEPWQTGFSESIIWQIDLDSVYSNAATLNSKLWSGINFNGAEIRNIHPVQGGSEPTDSVMYFLSNRNFALENDSIFLLKINGTTNNNNTELSYQLLTSDIKYGLAPNALQIHQDSLATNDSRVLGAFIENQKIQFVSNSINFNNGKPSVFHGIINDIGNPTVLGNIITDDSLEFGYPNIAYAGHNSNETQSIISFNHTSKWHFAGNSAVLYHSNNTYSNVKTLKKGEGYIDRLNGLGYERWGDYYGIQRKYNEPGKVWTAGFYGRNNNRNYTWISEIITNVDATVNNQKLSKKSFSSNLYPNPSSNTLYFDFYSPKNDIVEINIIDISGKIIKNIYKDKVKAGKNQLSINISSLSSGIYFLNLKGAYFNEQIKFIKK